jgi:hypothetical protein
MPRARQAAQGRLAPPGHAKRLHYLRASSRFSHRESGQHQMGQGRDGHDPAPSEDRAPKPQLRLATPRGAWAYKSPISWWPTLRAWCVCRGIPEVRFYPGIVRRCRADGPHRCRANVASAEEAIDNVGEARLIAINERAAPNRGGLPARPRGKGRGDRRRGGDKRYSLRGREWPSHKSSVRIRYGDRSGGKPVVSSHSGAVKNRRRSRRSRGSLLRRLRHAASTDVGPLRTLEPKAAARGVARGPVALLPGSACGGERS